MGKICGIYKITNPKESIYIGQSVDIKQRQSKYKHLWCKGQQKLYNSIIKYGWENHKFEVLLECKKEELNDCEVFYIKMYNVFNTEHGLNLKEGGSQGGVMPAEAMKKAVATRRKNGGYKISEETRKKLTSIKKPHSEETKQKMRHPHKKPSEETIKKISIANTGKKRSEETKAKMSKSHIGINTWMTGKKLSEETCKRIGKSHLGLKYKKHGRATDQKENVGRHRGSISEFGSGNEDQVNGKRITHQSQSISCLSRHIEMLQRNTTGDSKVSDSSGRTIPKRRIQRRTGDVNKTTGSSTETGKDVQINLF